MCYLDFEILQRRQEGEAGRIIRKHNSIKFSFCINGPSEQVSGLLAGLARVGRADGLLSPF